MRSRRWQSGALLFGLMVGCGDQGTEPGLAGGSAVFGNGSASIQGRVVTMRFVPESTFVPVAGVRVSIYFVDTIPSDTTPNDTTIGPPPDSSMVPLMQFMAMLDSFPPVDTLPPDSNPPPPPPPNDTLPTDTIPPDTNPPPPPPPVGCGRTGELVGVVETNREGRFRLRGLRPGKYDLVARADSGRGTGYFCGVHLLPDQRAEVNIFMPRVGGGR